MGCLGVHFALTIEDVQALKALADERERLAYLTDELEERYFQAPKSYIAQSDKSWDAMHRALCDGAWSGGGGGSPLGHVVLGGAPLTSDDDYIMSLKTPEQVRAIASALEGLTKGGLRERYDRIDGARYAGQLGDDDFEIMWSWFLGVRALYVKAAAEGRSVLFTADQ